MVDSEPNKQPILDRLRKLEPRVSLSWLPYVAPAYLRTPTEIVGFVAEYTMEMHRGLVEAGDNDPAHAINMARQNIGYCLGNYSEETISLWTETLRGADLLIGSLAGIESVGTLMRFEDHEDLAMGLRRILKLWPKS